MLTKTQVEHYGSPGIRNGGCAYYSDDSQRARVLYNTARTTLPDTAESVEALRTLRGVWRVEAVAVGEDFPPHPYDT